MNLKQLYYFSEIAKNRSFSLTAKNLFVSQPLLSNTVKQIEEELGVKLIYRTNRDFILTTEGELFLDSCHQVLNSFYDISNRMKKSREIQGKVTLCLPATILDIYFPEFLAEFADEFPHIEIEILEEGSYKVRDMVCSNEADLGVVMLPVDTKGMNCYSLVEDECWVVTNSSHRLSGKAVTNISELEDEKLVIYNKKFVLYTMIDEAFASHGITPRVVNTSSMPSFILKMVQLGQGISILPRPVLVLTSEHADLAISRLEPEIPWKIVLLESQKHYMSMAASCLKDAILKWDFKTIEKNHDYAFSSAGS